MNPLERSDPGAAGDEFWLGADFRVDRVGRRLLDARGAPVELSPRHFDALLYFVEHRDELLDKDRLLADLWPGQVVEENNLNKLVSALRRALGDDGEGRRYLLTVPRRGFRFVGEVRRAVPAAGASPASTAPVLPPVPAAAPPAANDPRADEPAVHGVVRLRRRRQLVAGGAALAALAGVGSLAWIRWRPAAPPPTTSATALAVLPFRPLLEGSRDEALELGMADSLIARLSLAPGVIVRAIGSVRRYAGRDVDAQAAARELGAEWVLEGTIQTSGDRIRVTARLLHATDGTAAWSGNFDERFTNVFDVQDAISRRVADVLVPHLSERQRAAVTGGGTRSADAYRLYVEARLHHRRFSTEAYHQARTLYERAIAADPRYTYAHAGLADLHRAYLFTSNAEPRAVFEAARAAATRAVEIDPQFGEAHAHLGWAEYWHDWDWPRAEQTMRRAAALNPSTVDAHNGLAHVLMTMRRGPESLQAFSRAREVDPQALQVNAFEGGMLSMLGRVDEGLERVGRALAISPRFWIGHLVQGSILLNTGQVEAGLRALRLAEELGSGSAWARAPLAHALARTGHSNEARAMLAKMLELARTGYFSPTNLALVHCGLGETALALDALERAYAVRDSRLVFLPVDHRWDPIRGEPRFVALARRLQVEPGPPPWKSTF